MACQIDRPFGKVEFSLKSLMDIGITTSGGVCNLLMMQQQEPAIIDACQ